MSHIKSTSGKSLKRARKIIKAWMNSNKEELDLIGLRLTELPEIPNNCRVLNCSQNKLVSIRRLPDACRTLICSYNLLEHLPELPNSLEELRCGSNELKYLPESVTQLKILECSNNFIEFIPDLPNCTKLYCNNNRLSKLPSLPNCTDLWCSFNKLREISDLPSCRELWCNDNPITHLPDVCEYIDLNCSHTNLCYLPHTPKIDQIILTGSVIYKPRAMFIQCPYLHINAFQSKKYNIKQTPNYYQSAKVIQKAYRKHKYKKYYPELSNYLCKNVSNLVCLYVL